MCQHKDWLCRELHFARKFEKLGFHYRPVVRFLLKALSSNIREISPAKLPRRHTSSLSRSDRENCVTSHKDIHVEG